MAKGDGVDVKNWKALDFSGKDMDGMRNGAGKLRCATLVPRGLWRPVGWREVSARVFIGSASSSRRARVTPCSGLANSPENWRKAAWVVKFTHSASWSTI